MLKVEIHKRSSFGIEGYHGDKWFTSNVNTSAQAHEAADRLKEEIAERQRRLERMEAVAVALAWLEASDAMIATERHKESVAKAARTRAHNRDPFGFGIQPSTEAESR